jgi:hypothetical protein
MLTTITRWNSVALALPAVIAGAAMAAYLGMNAVEIHPASGTPTVQSANITLADDDSDQAAQQDEENQQAFDEQTQPPDVTDFINWRQGLDTQ